MIALSEDINRLCSLAVLYIVWITVKHNKKLGFIIHVSKVTGFMINIRSVRASQVAFKLLWHFDCRMYW